MVMTIGDCGDGRQCARVATLGKLAATDAFNPIPANRSRPVCGLMVMTGLTGDDEGWLAQAVYDPHVGGFITTLNATTPTDWIAVRQRAYRTAVPDAHLFTARSVGAGRAAAEAAFRPADLAHD